MASGPVRSQACMEYCFSLCMLQHVDIQVPIVSTVLLVCLFRCAMVATRLSTAVTRGLCSPLLAGPPQINLPRATACLSRSRPNSAICSCIQSTVLTNSVHAERTRTSLASHLSHAPAAAVPCPHLAMSTSAIVTLAWFRLLLGSAV